MTRRAVCSMAMPVLLVVGIATALVQFRVLAGQPAPPSLAEAGRLLEAGRPADARIILEQVVTDARTSGDRKTEGYALANLGRALQLLGDADASERRLDEAEVVLTALGDDGALGRMLQARGLTAYGRGDRTAAESIWQRALDHYERAGQVREQASTLYNLTFVRREDRAEVSALLDRALTLARSVAARDVEGQILQRLGDEYALQGDYGTALDNIRAAAAVLDQAGRPDQLARALTSLGRVYRLHGSYDLALTAFERALAMHRTTNDIVGTGQSMNAVAVALRVLGRTADALNAAQAATAFLERRGDRTGTLALSYHTLATALEDSGRLTDAIEAVDKALASNPNPPDRPLMLMARADYLAATGRGEEAMALLAEAEVPSDARLEVKGSLLAIRAEVHARAGRLAPALDDAAAALGLFEAQRAQAAPVDGLKAGFDNVRQWAWALRVRLLARSGRQADALTATEGARARAFADLLAARRLPQSVPPPAAGVSSPVSMGPIGLEEIVAEATRLQTTVLAYWVERDRVRIWTVDGSGHVRGAEARVTARRLEQLVRATWARDGAKARVALAERGGEEGRQPAASNAERALRELHDLLVAPIADVLPRAGRRRLTIVPHGSLFRLSFAALRAATGRYLLEDFEIHYTPSMAVLSATHGTTGQVARDAGALVVAAPAFTREQATEGLVPLPAAATEGRVVAGLITGSSNTLLLGARATEDEVRRLVGHRRVLHFATHAVVSDDHPLDSFLALTTGSASAGGDGRLTAEEVYALRLDADLVVLSACRTAGGRVTGDGISGLARAFVYAGTPSLVATLWDLPDVTGAHALPRFYRAWSASGDKAASLRVAQLELLRALRAGEVAVDTPAGRFVLPEHPSFWAGLVLIGEP